MESIRSVVLGPSSSCHTNVVEDAGLSRAPIICVRRALLAAGLVATLAAGCSAPDPESDAAESVAAAGARPVSAERIDPMAREPGEWITWGGDPHNTRYSALDQITAANAAQLQVAWRWSGETLDGRPDYNWKATPLYVDGVLYVPTGGSRVAAIDPASGETIWTFTPDPLRVGTRQFSGSSRAAAYWTDGSAARILHNSIDGRLFSIDAATGRLDPAFGAAGVVDLKQDLLVPGDARAVDDLGSTGPGIVVGDVIVIQVITNDGPRTNEGATPGYIRGYDIRTGERLWVFHTIPWEGEFGNDTWEDESWRVAGNASVWSMMSADPQLGYVYLPVESATNNFWGGQRPGDGLFGESIVCLDARTGERIWHFQILHHGIWDYDLPAAPILHDVVRNGETIKAVTVLTKQGMSFVFDRVTGEPVWPIEERPVPTEMAVPGERPSPTQPFPTRPPPYSNLGYHEEDVIDFTPALRAEALEILSGFVLGPMYTPPTLVGEGIPTRGTLVYPNFGGGANWNGGAVDIESNVMFVPTRNTLMAAGLRPADPELTDWQYVNGGLTGASWLRLSNGLPLNRPPWALVTATDMNAGEHLWSRSIGGAPDWIREHADLQGLDLDFDNMGQISVRPSPLVTKTALFLAESSNIGGDPGGPMFRAYDKATGGVLAEIELPARTSGAPMTYLHAGRQYIAIALAEQGHPAELVALALPTAGADAVTADTAGLSLPDNAAVRTAVTASPRQLALGREVFAGHCVVCHGADGGGTPQSNAPPLAVLGGLDEIRNMVAAGAAEMPGMATVLSDEEIDAVSRFLSIELAGAPDSESLQ